MAFSVQQILGWIDGRFLNPEVFERLGDIQVQGIATLALSQHYDLAFYFSSSFERDLQVADPGILVTYEKVPESFLSLPLWKTSVVLGCSNPKLAMALLSERFAAVDLPLGPAKVHPSAIVDPSVSLGLGVQIGPSCVVEKGVRLGESTVLYPGCYVGAACDIGKACVLFPHVCLYENTILGDRVRIHAGSVLGSDGFGYVPRQEGKKMLGHHKIYHFGRVVVGEDVEIGASSSVDRGTFSDTKIEKHVKIDNHVHIGHNCLLEEGAILCGGVALAGHVVIGKYAILGGMAGVTNRVRVGDGAQVGAMSLVSKNVDPGARVVGSPLRSHREHFRLHSWLNRWMREKEERL